MTQRDDISDKLIHFTRGETYHDAFAKLRAILNSRRLLAGNGMIRGGYSCVCFTEAPLPALSAGFLNPQSFTRYSPFGLMFDKSWIYMQGGRPVIYQSEGEFNLLPEIIRWRHVRYEPLEPSVVDFTWEREWRIRCTELCFSPRETAIVVPNTTWAEHLNNLHDAEQDADVQNYSLIFKHDIAEQYRSTFPWRIVSLS